MVIVRAHKKKNQSWHFKICHDWLSREQDKGSRNFPKTVRQDVLPDYYQQMKTGSEKETAEETDFNREE